MNKASSGGLSRRAGRCWGHGRPPGVEDDSGGKGAGGREDIKVKLHVLHQPGLVPAQTEEAGKVMVKLPTVLEKPAVRQE